MRKLLFTLFALGLIAVISLSSVTALKAQTPGLIYKPAVNGGNKVLDPNGDGYVSLSTKGFSSTNLDEGASHSEIPYKPFPVFMNEPLADLSTGAKNGHTDYAPRGTGSPLTAYFDGSNFLFRVRLAGQSTASKGYSILMDANNTLNSVGKNPGFEFEVVLATNFDVRIYDHRNNVNANPAVNAAGPIIFNGSVDQYSQQAVASSLGNNDPDYFYDFYIPLSAFNGGITASTPLRMTGVTVTSAKSGLFGVASDIGSVDDSRYQGNFIGALSDIIGSYPPTTPTGIQSGGFSPVKAKSPVVNGPLYVASTSISGYSVEAAGSTITVTQNGVVIGTTTVQSDGTWTLPIAANTLVENRAVSATVAPADKSVSDPANNVYVQSVACTTPTPEITGVNGTKGFYVQVPGAGTVNVYRNGVLLSVPNNSNVATSAGTQYISFGNGAGSMPNGQATYYVTFTPSGGGCTSAPSSNMCYVPGKGNNSDFYVFRAPVIRNAALTTSTTQLNIEQLIEYSYTLPARLLLYKNSSLIATSPTINSTGTTVWNYTVSNLKAGDAFYVKVETTESTPCSGTDISNKSQTATVASTEPNATVSAAPVITGDYCGTTTKISGTSSEAPGTAIRLFNGATQIGTTSVNAFGAWTISGLNIAGGSTITARATAPNKTESAASAPRAINTTYSGATPVITTSPVVEGSVNLRGTAPSSTIITLYINGEPLVDVDGNPKTVTTNGSGNWEFTSAQITPFDLYAGSKLTVRAKTAASSSCESAPSAEVIVQCKAPNTAITPTFSQPKYCPNTEVTVNLSTSESGIVYNLYKKDGTVFGYSVLGNGKPISLNSYPVPTDGTILIVKTIKIGANCSSQVGGDLVVSHYPPVPNNFILSATNTAGCPGTSSVITVRNALTGYSYQLINFQTKEKIGSALVPASNGDLSFPALAISQTTEYGVIITRLDGGCVAENVNSQKITITRSGPTVNQAVTPATSTICTGNSVLFSFSTQNTYVYRLINKATGLQVGSSITGNGGTRSLSTGLIAIAGTYNYRIEVTGGGCTSSLITEPTVTASNGPAQAISAGPTQTICGSTVTLQGSNPAPGSGTWTKTGGPAGGTITNPSSATTTVTGLTSGTHTFTWTVTTSCGGGTVGMSTVNIVVNCPASVDVRTTRFIDEFSNNDILAVLKDVDAGIISFTRTQGMLPPGTALELVNKEVVLKVVDRTQLMAGNYSFTTQTTDGSSAPAATRSTSSPMLIRMYSRSTPPAPLPVQLIHFTAQRAGNKIILDWITASEIDNDHFEIERSYDNIRFVSIGQVKGKGNSSELNRYTFTDNNPGSGEVFYRLKQVDFIGKAEYSKTVFVNKVAIDANTNAIAYPNPFKDNITVSFTAISDEHAQVMIVDSKGQEVFKGTYPVVLGTNEILLQQLSTLRSGVYILKIKSTGLSETLRLIKTQ